MEMIFSPFNSNKSRRSIYFAGVLVASTIASSCVLAFIAMLGVELGTEEDIETITSNQFFQLIIWVIVGFIIALIHRLGTLLLFILAGIYTLLCFNVVSLASSHEAFGELTNFSLLLFALSPPALLLIWCGVILLLWDRKAMLKTIQNKVTS